MRQSGGQQQPGLAMPRSTPRLTPARAREVGAGARLARGQRREHALPGRGQAHAAGGGSASRQPVPAARAAVR